MTTLELVPAARDGLLVISYRDGRRWGSTATMLDPLPLHVPTAEQVRAHLPAAVPSDLHGAAGFGRFRPLAAVVALGDGSLGAVYGARVVRAAGPSPQLSRRSAGSVRPHELVRGLRPATPCHPDHRNQGQVTQAGRRRSRTRLPGRRWLSSSPNRAHRFLSAGDLR